MWKYGVRCAGIWIVYYKRGVNMKRITNKVCKVASAVCMAVGIALLSVGTYLSFCEVVK